jgi:hypothetical protein
LLASGRPREALEHFPPNARRRRAGSATLLGHARAALAAGQVQEADRVSAEALALEPSCATAVVAMCARLAVGKAAEAADLGRAVRRHARARRRNARRPRRGRARRRPRRRSRCSSSSDRSRSIRVAAGHGSSMPACSRRATAIRRRSTRSPASTIVTIANPSPSTRSPPGPTSRACWATCPERSTVLRGSLRAAPHSNSQHLYAETLLAMGSYAAGWRQFEFRWMHETLVGKRVFYGRPEWNGQDLRGKTVLVQPSRASATS